MVAEAVIEVGACSKSAHCSKIKQKTRRRDARGWSFFFPKPTNLSGTSVFQLSGSPVRTSPSGSRPRSGKGILTSLRFTSLHLITYLPANVELHQVLHVSISVLKSRKHDCEGSEVLE